MLEKVIKYTDLNGNEAQDTYMFNFTRREAIKIMAKYNGDIMAEVDRLVKAGSNGMSGIIDMFEEIVLSAVGQKSPDGKSFIKSPEIVSQFENSMAYAQLFEDLLTDPKAMEEFVTGCIPADVAKGMIEPEETPQLQAVPTPKAPLQAVPTPKAPTAEEELKRILAAHPELLQK